MNTFGLSRPSGHIRARWPIAPYCPCDLLREFKEGPGPPDPAGAIPYGSGEWKRLYRGRSAVEREFGKLKHEYGLAPLRTRGLDRVRIHASLTMLAPAAFFRIPAAISCTAPWTSPGFPTATR